MSSAAFTPLVPPPEVDEKGGQEFLRVILCDGGLSIAMQRAFADPETWGLVLATLARQAAHIFATDENVSPSDILERICLEFDQQLMGPDEGDARPATEN